MVTNDCVSFSIHHSSIEICDDLHSSIKKWKPEIFFVDFSTFGPLVQIEDPPTRDHDSAPELTPEELHQHNLSLQEKLVGYKISRHPWLKLSKS
ncbi:unnamed protein product [Lactuca virosa]|uniref:Uncharacterized protein n=1 Tax=Lactuca virosa TaxID=75947 RepID=A0AAU9M812_9ASTR|nr:unnamed protein product [Lactuca virosa]